MRLKEISIHDSTLPDALREVYYSDNPVFLIRYPSVFALMAPPTMLGAFALSKGKNRLPGKFYGSAIGSAESFFSMAYDKHISEKFLKNKSLLESLESCFIRIKTHDAQTETAAVNAGTHQGLLLPDGVLRDLFRTLEDWGKSLEDRSLFPGKNYTAPLCTSANISGDPAGSIVDEMRARDFAVSMHIRLMIHAEENQGEKGSYPVLAFDDSTVRVERGGPGLASILSMISGYFTRLNP
jgi:hypothetical protein